MAHDEGLQLQKVVQEVLAEHDFLKNLLGAEAATSLEKRASNALCESQSDLESLSKCLVSFFPVADLYSHNQVGQ